MEQPKWSPDGSTIAVAGPNGDQIVGGLIAADGTGFHLFAPPDRTLNAACVLWSPDGIRLACEVWDDDHPGRHGVYTVRAADGGDLQRVTRGRDIPCAWSPDGSQLVFMRSGSDEDRFFLMIARSDGGWERRLGFVEVGGACDWSPDGRTILTELDGSLLLVDLDGKVNPIHIQAPAGATYTWSSRPAFSPDGSSIVFSFDAGDGQADIYTIRTNGSDLTRITDTPNDGEEFADWGP
jgi:TolB protein